MKEIIYNLINSFDIYTLKIFLNKKDGEFEFKEKELRNPEDDFSEIELVAEKRLEDRNNFGVFAIKTGSQLSERTSKKRQFELAKKLLNNYFDCGLFVFYDEKGNFRFSFVYKTYKGEKAEISSYKRYTYFVEKGKRYRTFEKALTEIKFDSLQIIKQAFSTKPLIDEFYTEIQNWYAWALKDENIFFPSGKKEEHLIRLITRLVFVWFLKERKLIPEDIFEPDKLKDIVKNFMQETNYYNAVIQNLFFATLNTEIENRKFAENKGFPENKKEFGVKTLYRYSELLNISKEEFINLFKNTPFVNGGLFECLDEDKNYIDGFTRNEKQRAKIPDYLFFSDEKSQNLSEFYGKEKKEKVRGLINILKDYNFTADESTPIDIEVSLDPELLGHIFENLLASYNPETQETARKSTGSYYTPSEIVDFMVEIAVLEYLKQKTDIDHQKLEQAVGSYGDTKLSDKEKQQIIQAIDDKEKQQIIQAIDSIKILDPAVGSGAFPMGVLHKLVSILEKIDPDNSLWKEYQYKKTLKEVEKILKEENKDIREELLKELNENFDEALRYPDYARKIYIIQNSIYGVDIQPIAIQITKLRFFLSLLIDQKIEPSKYNLGIKPLPHLETNFISANSLIKLKHAQLSFIPEGISELKSKLLELYKKHFNVKTRQEKKKIQEEAQKIRKQIRDILVKSGWHTSDANKIAEFDIFNQLSTANWFNPEWMFGIEDGFDIVIGNPPYIKEYTNKEIFSKLKKSEYYQGKMDISYFFTCVSIDLIKKAGILTFIIPNNWTTNFGAKKMRKKIINETKILKIIDFGSFFVFESSNIQTMILVLKKINQNENYSFDYKKIIKEKPSYSDLIKILNKELSEGIEYLNPTIIKTNYKQGQNLVFSENMINRLLSKIDNPKYFNIKGDEIIQGIVMPQDFLNKKNSKKLDNKYPTGSGIFVISQKELEELNLSEEEKNLIKPYYTTKELFKWFGNRKNQYWLIYTKPDINQSINKYPNIRKHLDKFKDIISSDNKPYGLHRARKEKFFKGEKIISLRKTKTPSFTYIDYDCYVSQTFFVIKTNRINMKYLTGILNSKLIALWLFHKGKKQGNLYQIDKEPLMSIPISPITEENKPIAQQIENLVSHILELKSINPQTDTTNLENQIDQLVYQLYNLTEEEIKLIEGGKSE